MLVGELPRSLLRRKATVAGTHIDLAVIDTPTDRQGTRQTAQHLPPQSRNRALDSRGTGPT